MKVIPLFTNSGRVCWGPTHVPWALAMRMLSTCTPPPEGFLWLQDHAEPFRAQSQGTKVSGAAHSQRWVAVVGNYVSSLASLGDSSVCVPESLV